jgi:hypothetical protein
MCKRCKLPVLGRAEREGRKEGRTGRKEERRENKVAYQSDDIVQNQSESRAGTWSVEVILEVPLEMAVKKASSS